MCTPKYVVPHFLLVMIFFFQFLYVNKTYMNTYVVYILNTKICKAKERLAYSHRQSPLSLYVYKDETNLSFIIWMIIEREDLNTNIDFI